jgi:hypothetical protein
VDKDKNGDEDKKDGKPGIYKPSNPRELLLTIAKTRDGGVRCKVPLWWAKHFTNLETRRPKDDAEVSDYEYEDEGYAYGEEDE